MTVDVIETEESVTPEPTAAEKEAEAQTIAFKKAYNEKSTTLRKLADFKTSLGTCSRAIQYMLAVSELVKDDEKVVLDGLITRLEEKIIEAKEEIDNMKLELSELVKSRHSHLP